MNLTYFNLFKKSYIPYIFFHSKHFEKDKNDFPLHSFLRRFGYFGKDKPEVVRAMFCHVSGCLTDGQTVLSASGDEMVHMNTRDIMGIRILKREGVEVCLPHHHHHHHQA